MEHKESLIVWIRAIRSARLALFFAATKSFRARVCVYIICIYDSLGSADGGANHLSTTELYIHMGLRYYHLHTGGRTECIRARRGFPQGKYHKVDCTGCGTATSR